MRWWFVLALVACGGKKDEGPTCDQVADKILEIGKNDMPGHGDVSFRGLKKPVVDDCVKKALTAEVRTCIMGAKTPTDIMRCRGLGKSDAYEKPRRPRPSGSGSAGSAAPAAAGSGAGSGSS